MSSFGGGGQFDDGDVERQIQEEFRRRQALQQAGVGPAAFSAALAARARQAQQQQQQPVDYGSRLGMLGADTAAAAAAASQYYAARQAAAVGAQQAVGGHPHHASPYTRVTNPYAGIADAREAAYRTPGAGGGGGGGAGAADHQGPLAQLYAAQHRRQHQAVQQAVASNYAAAYGAPASAGTAAVLEQYHAAAYGIPAATTAAAKSTTPYCRESSYPPSGTPTQEITMMQRQHSSSYGQERANAVMPSQATPKMQPVMPFSPKPNLSRSSSLTKSNSKNTARAQAKSANSTNGNSNQLKNTGGDAEVTAPPTPNADMGTPIDTEDEIGAAGIVALATPSAGGVTASNSKAKDPPLPQRTISKDGKSIMEDGTVKWYTGCVPLGLEDDKYWLSELQVYLRAHFAEAFGATEEDIAAPMHGRNKPIALGQVGIRCMHCKHDNPAERGQQATSYPSLISGIYNSVQQMLRLHMECCVSMPLGVRAKIEQLKLSCSSRGGRKQYWIDSAKRLGLVDTPHGIHFGRDPLGPLPPLTGPSVNSKEGRKKKNPPKATNNTEAAAPDQPGAEPENEKPAPPVDTRPLVFPDDKPLISDYLYLTLEQMAPCVLMEADRVGCYKTRKVGFPGLSCKHCVGQAGCGRYFPASEASLSQTTTSQTIMNHVRNCRRCPHEIRETLEIMKRNRMGPDGKRADKPKHGGRKVFFHRLWCRIQGIPFEEGKGEPKEVKKKKPKKQGPKRKKKSSSDDAERDSDDDGEDAGGPLSSAEEETESEEETDVSDEESEVAAKPKEKKSPAPTPAPTPSPAAKKKSASPWHEGCVRLTKTDDPHWLSEMECFARSDLVEVFSLKKKDVLDGYGGRKEPSIGQVGVRCVFCKSLDASERSNGCISFPDSISSVHTKVADMIRLHFPSCPSMSDDARETFKSLRGFDAKVANDDSLQYWIDSARDIGLSNVSPAGPRAAGGWGITFRRDPLQPSPADELDLEATNGSGPSSNSKNALVRADDRGLCTDQVMLLLRQVRPCRFKNSDRRAGPGSRGRDRSMGFPGISCLHCVGRNTLGRYFPVSAKNLTDSTANSLQTHVASCTYCPEPIKASLAFLGHRSILQKAELSGSWKKAFFKKIWDRLHVERGWTSIDDEEVADNIEYQESEDQPVEEDGTGSAAAAATGAAGAHPEEEEETKEGAEGDDDADSDKEELGDHMNALIKAAAIWLTEQDAATDNAKSGSRTNRGKSLPAKRPAATQPSKGGRGATALPTKRRRVHF